MISTLQLILTLLSGVISVFTKSGAPAELIAALQAALAKIQAVHDTAVTKPEIDSLLLTYKW
jgi:outer membrane lipoprotein-sorting protein